MAKVDKFHRQLGSRIKAARISAGYESAADFARALGFEPPTVRKWERGESEPTVRKWERGESEPTYLQLADISRATKTTLDFLVLGINDSK